MAYLERQSLLVVGYLVVRLAGPSGVVVPQVGVCLVVLLLWAVLQTLLVETGCWEVVACWAVALASVGLVLEALETRAWVD